MLLKSDPIAYNKLYKNIVLERIGYNYMLIEIYGPTMNPMELQERKLQTKADIELIGMSACAEGKVISQLFTSWGV